jgi:hypothetical protein
LTPSLRFPPARRGNQTGARCGSPREAGEPARPARFPSRSGRACTPARFPSRSGRACTPSAVPLAKRGNLKEGGFLILPLPHLRIPPHAPNSCPIAGVSLDSANRGRVQSWRIRPARRVRGVWRPPGDKSITHRAVILGLLARGATEIEGFLESDDCLRTLRMAQQLGASAERVGAAHWRIVGRGGSAAAGACGYARCGQLRHDGAADGGRAGSAAVFSAC